LRFEMVYDTSMPSKQQFIGHCVSQRSIVALTANQTYCAAKHNV